MQKLIEYRIIKNKDRQETKQKETKPQETED